MPIRRLVVLGLLALSFSCERHEQADPHLGSTVKREQSLDEENRVVHAQNSVTVEESVRQRWSRDRSYYAFLEIIDQLDPNFRNSAPTMKDIELAVGPPTCAGPGCYPTFTKRDWLYDTERSIPAGSKAILSFDEHDVLKSIDWVSE
jgi:hypothetical protein